MAKKARTDLKATDLVDAHGASTILGCTPSRIHQYAQDERLKTYIFLDGEFVEAEGEERQGKISMFDRYDVARLPRQNRKGGRPRKYQVATTS
jgi:hypothetical protein